jgi:hypothetical protein
MTRLKPEISDARTTLVWAPYFEPPAPAVGTIFTISLMFSLVCGVRASAPGWAPFSRRTKATMFKWTLVESELPSHAGMVVWTKS